MLLVAANTSSRAVCESIRGSGVCTFQCASLCARRCVCVLCTCAQIAACQTGKALTLGLSILGSRHQTQPQCLHTKSHHLRYTGAGLCLLQVEHYESVLPAIFGIMTDPDPAVQERACYALDTFCENMERENILPFMPQASGLGLLAGRQCRRLPQRCAEWPGMWPACPAVIRPLS